MKTCTKCGEEKELDCFYKNKRSADGFNYKCKNCDSDKSNKWHSKNKAKTKENNIIWMAKNIVQVKKKQKKYRSKNAKEIKNKQKEYRLKNKDKIFFYREKTKEKNKLKRKSNRININITANKWRLNQRANLSDWYIKKLMKAKKLPITPELIEIKRLTIKINRLIKQKQS